jgi:hypothetical protein
MASDVQNGINSDFKFVPKYVVKFSRHHQKSQITTPGLNELNRERTVIANTRAGVDPGFLEGAHMERAQPPIASAKRGWGVWGPKKVCDFLNQQKFPSVYFRLSNPEIY